MNPLNPRVYVDLSVPAFKAALRFDDFRNLFRATLESQLCLRTRNKAGVSFHANEYRQAAREFEQYMSALGQVNIQPSEQVLDDFRTYLIQQGKSSTNSNMLTLYARHLLNRFPATILQRQLVDAKTYNREQRYAFLTPDSRTLIKDYERNAHRIRNGKFTARKLTERSRENVVGRVLQFMRKIGRNSFLDVTAEDADEYADGYRDQNMERTGINTLCDVHAFFRFLLLSGVLAEDPLEAYTEKMECVNTDFVFSDGIALLGDIQRIDPDDYFQLQNAFLCYVLCYDFALRIGEVALLNMSDIQLEGDFVHLKLRGEIQKGGNKRDAEMWSTFPQSFLITRLFLESRRKNGYESDAVIIQTRGRRAANGACGSNVSDHCERLGVKTFNGKRVTPHRLRHSYGSLHVEEFGVYYIMERLRHEDINTTRRIYIDRNPLLLKQRHIQVTQRRQPNIHEEATPPPTSVPQEDHWIDEDVALKRMAHLGIKPDALERYAEKSQKVTRAKGVRLYSSGFINDLATNWITKQRAMDLLKLKKSGLFYFLESHRIVSVVIGKRSLLPQQAIFSAMSQMAG